MRAAIQCELGGRRQAGRSRGKLLSVSLVVIGKPVAPALAG